VARASTAGERDGRVERGARNRERIVEALFELVRAGELQPTAEQVAARAGVGTRTVFRHFDDMESLRAEVSARLEEEAAPLLERTLGDGDLEQRTRDLIAGRIEFFERIAPFKSAGDLHRWRSRFLQQSHASVVRRLRSDLVRALPELARARPDCLEALDLVTSFEAWDRLRSEQRLGRQRARAAIELAALAILRDLESE